MSQGRRVEEKDRRAIVELHDAGRSNTEIARRLKLALRTIGRILVAEGRGRSKFGPKSKTTKRTENTQ